MEEKLERLKESIELNKNLSEEVKMNITSLASTLVSVYPDYDYSLLARRLSNLVVNVNDGNNYSSYDAETNTLKFNTNKILEDRIDLQHLFLNEMLKMNRGVSDEI